MMTESYQGVGPDFFPVDYAQKLEAFCREHDIVLTMDEVQAGLRPHRQDVLLRALRHQARPDRLRQGDLSSLPLSAVIGRQDIMDLYPPGSMTSTHSASPLRGGGGDRQPEVLQKEKLVEQRGAAGRDPRARAATASSRSIRRCWAALQGKGLVAGIQVVKPGTKEPDPETGARRSTWPASRRAC